MCLGVPAKIIEIYTKNDLLMGKLDFGGVFREACLMYVPEAKIGDYAVIHVGFALNLLDVAEAQETLDLLRQVDLMGENTGDSLDDLPVDEEIADEVSD